MHICETTSEQPSNHMLHCFVRLRWHAVGIFRDTDGEFEGCAAGRRISYPPESSWPDNAN